MSRQAVRQGTLGRGLAYVRTGRGAPLVLCAPFSGDHRPPRGLGLRLQAQQLAPYARRRDVWWVHRRQGLPAGSTMRDVAADYADALRDTFAAPVDVLGTSTGGSVALQLTADHPDVVRRLVLLCAAYRLGERGRASQRRVAELLRAGRRREALGEVMSMLGTTDRSRRLLGRLGRLAPPKVFFPEDVGDCLATIEAEDSFDLRDRLAGIHCPVLVVGGDRDAYYDDGALFSETAAVLPDARLVLYRGKGHAAVAGDRRVPAGVLGFLDA